MNPAYIAHYLEQALQIRRQEAASIFVIGQNVRAYSCCVSECVRPAYASGYCNAHYMRWRKGQDLMPPLRARKREDRCAVCQEATGAKGGWGLCAKHYKKERAKVLKDAAITLFGGECAHCGGVFHRAAFDFHHVAAKDNNPSELLNNASMERIGEELANCKLLCANCHRIEHANDV